ncbi:Mth938-like domain-containing protein [Thermococcus sp.]
MIEDVRFGSVMIDGKKYEHDLVIYPSGKIERRKKEISKKKHGTSHKFDPDELREYLTEDFDILIVGTGIYGMLSLLPESRKLVEDKEIIEKPTPEAVRLFNELRKKKRVLGIFHVTC